MCILAQSPLMGLVAVVLSCSLPGLVFTVHCWTVSSCLLHVLIVQIQMVFGCGGSESSVIWANWTQLTSPFYHCLYLQLRPQPQPEISHTFRAEPCCGLSYLPCLFLVQRNLRYGSIEMSTEVNGDISVDFIDLFLGNSDSILQVPPPILKDDKPTM